MLLAVSRYYEQHQMLWENIFSRSDTRDASQR